MICKIPQTEPWTSHLVKRKESAIKIGLLDRISKLSLLKAAVFVPDELDINLLESVKPNCPLRDIQSKKKASGWVKRDDLLDESAKHIFKKYSSFNGAELFCEAGYSERGDKVLENRQHVVFNNRPFLNQKLSESSSERIAQTLRWARSRHLLGIVADMSICQTFGDSAMNRLLFICDAFDGDSIILTGVELGLVEQVGCLS